MKLLIVFSIFSVIFIQCANCWFFKFNKNEKRIIRFLAPFVAKWDRKPNLMRLKDGNTLDKMLDKIEIGIEKDEGREAAIKTRNRLDSLFSGELEPEVERDLLGGWWNEDNDSMENFINNILENDGNFDLA